MTCHHLCLKLAVDLSSAATITVLLYRKLKCEVPSGYVTVMFEALQHVFVGTMNGVCRQAQLTSLIVCGAFETHLEPARRAGT